MLEKYFNNGLVVPESLFIQTITLLQHIQGVLLKGSFDEEQNIEDVVILRSEMKQAPVCYQVSPS